MIGTVSGDISVAITVLVLLFVFAIYFNQKIEQVAPAAEGFVWLEVVIGVFITLVGVGVLDLVLPGWNAFFIGLVAFTASGLPMAWGAYRRHKDAISRFLKAMKEQ